VQGTGPGPIANTRHFFKIYIINLFIIEHIRSITERLISETDASFQFVCHKITEITPDNYNFTSKINKTK